ncbi:hypothetical protein BDQ17DRAFT_59245 [Cyathus striatus]|nr:hypothetical protein BDQ17DRAFT_59245 [Cyathus striatus]
MECSDYAQTNPDISGVGVRISFYLQTFLLILLVDRSWQDAPVALWTFIATSFGITLAAIVQREQLSLFQALEVSNLVWLANFGTFVALASYSRQKAADEPFHYSVAHRAFDYRVKYGAMIQTLFSMVLTLYIWARAATFGSNRQCSHAVKYMLFVFEVPAISTGRTIALTMVSLLSLAYTSISFHELRIAYRSRKMEVNNHYASSRPRTSKVAVSYPTAVALRHEPNLSKCSCRQWSLSSSVTHTGGNQKTRGKSQRWSSDLDPMFVGIVICQVLIFTYFIVSSELFLRNNPSPNSNDGQWGFGQILALIVVLPSALSVGGALKRHGFRRLSKRKTRRTSRKG